MKAYYLRLITAAIVAGININSFCAKHRALKGALRSMIFKLWNRCKLLAARKTVYFKTIKHTDLIRVIVNNGNYQANRALPINHVVSIQNARYYADLFNLDLVSI